MHKAGLYLADPICKDAKSYCWIWTVYYLCREECSEMPAASCPTHRKDKGARGLQCELWLPHYQGAYSRKQLSTFLCYSSILQRRVGQKAPGHIRTWEAVRNPHDSPPGERGRQVGEGLKAAPHKPLPPTSSSWGVPTHRWVTTHHHDLCLCGLCGCMPVCQGTVAQLSPSSGEGYYLLFLA